VRLPRASLLVVAIALAVVLFVGVRRGHAGPEPRGPGRGADLLPKKEGRIAARDALTTSGAADATAGATATTTAATTVSATAASAAVSIDADQAAADKKKKAWQAELRKRIGKPPPALINFYNTWTHEYVVVDALKGAIPPEQADRMLRCHFTNEPADMDDRLIPSVLKAARKFKSSRVDIVSGYRAPKYNLMIRKKGHEVARDSQHTHGNAVDFRLRGVGVKALHQWAVALRLGGVGLYTQNQFIHIDTARVRYWGGE
jgi:hypothetical protein